jgi:molecular chaperone DnaK
MEICEAIEYAEKNEDYLAIKDLKEKQKETIALVNEIESLPQDDVTDARYQLEDQKRKIAGQIDKITRSKKIDSAKSAYIVEKECCFEIVAEAGNDYEKRLMANIFEQENIFLAGNSTTRINEKKDMLRDIRLNILWRTPGFLVHLFQKLLDDRVKLNNQEQAQIFIEAGQNAIQNENFNRLAEINNELITLLPHTEQNVIKSFTGIRL